MRAPGAHLFRAGRGQSYVGGPPRGPLRAIGGPIGSAPTLKVGCEAPFSVPREPNTFLGQTRTRHPWLRWDIKFSCNKKDDQHFLSVIFYILTENSF